MRDAGNGGFQSFQRESSQLIANYSREREEENDGKRGGETESASLSARCVFVCVFAGFYEQRLGTWRGAEGF